MRFKLKKWYMDLVNPEGGAFIGYSALAKLGPLPLKYASVLELSAGGVEERGGALGVREPEAGENGLIWSFEGKETFSCASPAFPAGKLALLDDSRGRITWHCRAASVPGRAAGAGEGLAYCESLELELEKFRLPIETLYWGHFSAPGRSLVWLKWEGPVPLSLLLLDGKEIGGEVSAGGLVFDGGKLVFGGGRVIRSGFIGETALASFPAKRSVLPRELLEIHEHKELSRSVLRSGGAEIPGWALHEVVKFPK